MAVTRKDFLAIDFMMEATPGVNPGIVSASYVDGSDTTEGAYVPNLTNGDKAFALLFEPIEGLPEVGTVEVTEVKSVRDVGNKRLPGLKNNAEVTLTFAMHGWAAAPGSSDVPGPPPWLQIASAGCGHIYGNVAASDKGGARTTIASVGPDNVTAGTVIDGHCFAVKDASASTTTVQVVRPDDAASTEVTSYQIDTGFTKATSDPVYYSCQTHFDTRNDLIGPVGGSSAPTTYTLLIHRADRDAAQILKGCRCNKIEISAKAGEVPTIKVTLLAETWTTYTDDPTGADWNGYTGMPGKPMYGSTCFDDIWPDPEITQRANFVWMDSTTRRTPHISEFSYSIEFGYSRYMASTGVEGVAGAYPTGTQRATCKFTVLYDANWREYLGVSSLPFLYWQGLSQGRIWFCGMTNARLTDGPGFDKDADNKTANEIMLEAGDYCDDADTYAAGLPAQSTQFIGVI